MLEINGKFREVILDFSDEKSLVTTIGFLGSVLQ